MALDITPVNGWTANSNINVKAIVKDPSNNTESTWVDSVWRPAQCQNGIDDDGDGKTDYRPWDNLTSDSKCTNSNDDNEFS